jgi:hypothetical protein
MPQRPAEPPNPFDCIKQEKGQYVVTFPGAVHMVVNIGSNCAEAINVCLPEWEEEQGRSARDFFFPFQHDQINRRRRREPISSR